MQLRWTDLADADLGHIEAYIAKENDPVVAIDVVLHVINSAELVLPDHPHAGRLGKTCAYSSPCGCSPPAESTALSIPIKSSEKTNR